MANSQDFVIDLRGVRKRFGRTQALDGLDLAVAAGTVHGFLGPNGAGKSTTIRILLGLVHRDAGAAALFGADPWSAPVLLHQRLAYVPGEVALWPWLTGGQAIAALATSGPRLNQAWLSELTDRFELDPSRRIRDYSKGNRQKVVLIAALASDVGLLILDEPTSGLDPLMEQVFQRVVRERAAQGVTVLLSSHILAEVDALCSHVSIVRTGQVVRTGTLADLRATTRTQVEAMTARPVPDVAGSPGVDRLTADDVGGGQRLRFTVDSAHLDAVLGLLHTAGIRSLTVQPPSLDDLFLSAFADTPTR